MVYATRVYAPLRSVNIPHEVWDATRRGLNVCHWHTATAQADRRRGLPYPIAHRPSLIIIGIEILIVKCYNSLIMIGGGIL